MSQKIPYITKEKAEQIAQKYPTPFYLYDEAGIEYFAVKATPNPYILQILKEEGCGADCSSLTELQMSHAAGLTGRDVMFSSNETPAEDMQLAKKMGAIINLDDLTHVEFLEQVAGIPETNPGDSKYGMTREQMVQAYKMLMQKGAKHFGIHAFLASNTVTNAYYPELARQLFALAVELKEETGADITFINLSGGVGISYHPEQAENDILAIGEGVRKVFEEVLVPAGMGNVSLFTEMGRFMLAPFGALVTRAIHEKHIYKEYIGVDACAANLMRPAMYGSYHHITVLGKENAELSHVYDVVGGLCENNDKFAIDRKLPEIEKGDLLFIHDAGAHGFSMGYNYNGFIHDAGAHGFSMGYNYNGKLRSAELLLQENGEVKMIRRAEEPKDYFATFDFSEEFPELKTY